jgi:hypothetical protein
MKNENINGGAELASDITSTAVTAPTPVIDVIPTPERLVSAKHPLRVRLHVGKDFLRVVDLPHGDARRKPIRVLHVYPTLADYAGRTIPDNVNPRSHDPSCLKSPVARQIEHTLTDRPEDFVLANRGSTIIAESYDYNPQKGELELVISDPENEGLADGATTDAVLAKVQAQVARSLLNKPDANYRELQLAGDTPESLKSGRIHLEVFVNLDDRSRIASLVAGRNTSRQVRGWSMADFRGQFDWLKDVLEKPESGFMGRIGYEENSDCDVSILDILALLTLFHPEFDAKGEAATAPVVAYTSRGRMDARLSDEELLKGYQGLTPLLLDILKLHDHVYSQFETVYDKAYGKKSRLARRRGVEAVTFKLPLTGAETNYKLPAGYVYPLLASLRALVYRRGGNIKWRINPFEFFDTYGPELVAELMEQAEALGGDPNTTGKKKLVYTALHNKAKVLLTEELEK